MRRNNLNQFPCVLLTFVALTIGHHVGPATANVPTDSNEGVPVAVGLPPGVEVAARATENERANTFRVNSAIEMSRQLVERYGPPDAKFLRAFGRSEYLLPQNLDLFVVPAAEGGLTDLIAVPQGVVVGNDGRMYLPSSIDGDAEPATFTGPWGTERSFPFSRLFQDQSGSGECSVNPWDRGTTEATTSGLLLLWKLADTSTSADYYGTDTTAVTRVTKWVAGCNDYIDFVDLSVTFTPVTIVYGSFNYGSAWQALSPRTDKSGTNCTSTELSVSAEAPIGGGKLGGTIKKSYTWCDGHQIWAPLGQAAGTPNAHRDVYDNKGRCSAASIEQSLLSVVKVNQNMPAGPSVTLTGDVDNSWIGC